MRGQKHYSKLTVFILLSLAVAVTCYSQIKTETYNEITLAETTDDHGRKKDDSDKATKKGDLYGDLWVVVRDVTAGDAVEPGDNNLGCDGDPILFEWVWPEAAYNTDGDFSPQDGTYPIGYRVGTNIKNVGFVQPISFTAVTVDGAPFNAGVDDENDDIIGPNEEGQFVYHDYINSYGVPSPVYLIPLDPAEGKIPDVYAQQDREDWDDQVMEVDMGRLNIARSTQEVIDARYAEALMAINEATAIELDPAGRLLLTLEGTDEDGEPIDIVKTIDAALENLALYQALMRDGCLTGLDASAQELMDASSLSHLVCSAEATAPDADDLIRAASFMAGAGDKFGHINTDLVVTLNTALGLNRMDYISAEKVYEISRYFDYADCNYVRSTTYTQVVDLLQPNENGDGWVTTPVTLFDNVFEGDWSLDSSPAMPLIKFVRAADDALGVIFYIHNFAIPEYPVEQRQ